MPHRRALGAATGIVASLAIAGTALGASWAPPLALSSADNGSWADVASLDAQHEVAAYVESGADDHLFTRTTANGGASWGTPLPISDHGISPALAAEGMNVDLVWNSSNNGRVFYARSIDGGVSFGTPVTISPAGRVNWVPAVGRGPAGLVAVAYVDVVSGDVIVRVSTNGGTSFGPRVVLEPNGEEQSIAVAVGDGIIYVAYSLGFEKLRLRHSADAGAHWSSPAVITNNLFDDRYSLAASGDDAYIAFSRSTNAMTFTQVQYRRTINGGNTWSSPIALASSSWSTWEPDLAIAGGVLRAAFTRCAADFDVCVDNRSYYRQSSDGTSWGLAQRISPKTIFDAFSPKVAAHRALVVYVGDDATSETVYARTKN